jgi:hypothetical protein
VRGLGEPSSSACPADFPDAPAHTVQRTRLARSST